MRKSTLVKGIALILALFCILAFPIYASATEPVSESTYIEIPLS